jgi:hypothetical protein
MAQWKSSPFDIVYDDKLNTNLRLLRSAADLWSARGAAALTADEVLAVILRVFARRWSASDLPSSREEKIRALHSWLAEVANPERECLGLTRVRQPRCVEAALADLRELLGRAAASWSAGSPEDPPTEAVMREVARTLFRHRLLHRPPPARIDDCFGAS